MSNLIDLSSRLIGAIVFEWCELTELVLFDSALTRRDVRDSFQSYYKFNSVFIFNSSRFKMTLLTLQWLELKYVGINGANLPSEFGSVLPINDTRWFKHLTFLEVHNATLIDVDALLAMSVYCTKLQSLSLMHSIFITPELLASFHAHSINLTSISAEGTLINDDALISFVNEHTLMINVSNCVNITDRLFAHIAATCPALTTLHMNEHSVSATQLEALCRGCSRLTSLSNRGNTSLVDEGLEFITQCCPSIRVVDFSYCISLDDSAVQSMLENVDGCKHIEDIRLQCCFALTDSVLEAVAVSCPSLTVLDMTDCSSISDSGLMRVILHCKLLRELHVQECENVSNTTLRNLSRHCPTLESLNVSYCEGCTDISLLVGCPLLQRVMFDPSDALSDEHVLKLTTNCPKITRLHLTDCTNITDTAVVAIAETYGPQLEELFLRRCANLTLTSLHSIVSHCKRLKVLDIRDCPSVLLTPLSVLCVAGAFPRLRTLGVSLDVSRPEFAALVRARPALKIVGDADKLSVTR